MLNNLSDIVTQKFFSHFECSKQAQDLTAQDLTAQDLMAQDLTAQDLTVLQKLRFDFVPIARV